MIGGNCIVSHFRAPRDCVPIPGGSTISMSVTLDVSVAIAPYYHMMPLLGHHCPGWSSSNNPWDCLSSSAWNQRFFHEGWLCSSFIPSGEIQGSSCRLPSLTVQTVTASQLPLHEGSASHRAGLSRLSSLSPGKKKFLFFFQMLGNPANYPLSKTYKIKTTPTHFSHKISWELIGKHIKA